MLRNSILEDEKFSQAKNFFQAWKKYWNTCVSVSAMGQPLVCPTCSSCSQLAHVSAYSSELVIDLPGSLYCLILLIITQKKGDFVGDLAFWSGNYMTHGLGHLTLRLDHLIFQWRLCVELRWNLEKSKAGD